MSWSLLLNLLAPEPVAPSTEATWVSVLQEAREHRLLLQVCDVIQRHGWWTELPGAVQDELSEELSRKSITALHRCRQLSRLLALFQSHGIRTLTFKGPVLTQMLYGRVTARESRDLDLLVAPEDFEAALRLLADSGFESELAKLPRCYTRFNNAVALENREWRLTVDLHYRLLPNASPYRLGVSLEAPSSLEIQGESYPTLGPEELFFYLCLHASKHAWTELKWLYDIQVLARRFSAETMLARARERQMERPVSVAYLLLHEQWGVSLPRNLSSDAAVKRLGRAASRFLRRGVSSWGEYYRFQADSIDRFWPRHRYRWRVIFEPQMKDLYLVDLPKRLWFLYYALRPVRVALSCLSRRDHE